MGGRRFVGVVPEEVYGCCDRWFELGRFDGPPGVIPFPVDILFSAMTTYRYYLVVHIIHEAVNIPAEHLLTRMGKLTVVMTASSCCGILAFGW